MRSEQEIKDRIKDYEGIVADRTSYRTRSKYREVIHNLKWVLNKKTN